MMGWGMPRIAGMSPEMYCIDRIAIRDMGSPSQFGGIPISSRFIPEQNAPRAPVKTTTLQSLSL
jgi:hypothetical protein